MATRIARAVGEAAKKIVRVEWENGHHSAYSMAWLRDNCRCPTCFSQVSKNRQNLMKDLMPETLSHSKIIPSSTSMSIEWNDGHLSPYEADWLMDRDPLNAKKRLQSMEPKRQLWNKEALEAAGGIPRMDYSSLLTSDDALKEWIEHLRTIGLVILQGCPLQEGPCDQIANRIGFYKTTHYGAHWSIKVRSDPNNVAYSGKAIGLHTDLSYYSNPPGVGLFHCIQQFPGEGGASEFCDGFNVLNVLKEEDSESFNVLDTIPLTFWDFGGEHHTEETGLDTTFLKRRLAKTIERDMNGNIWRINYNNQGRDPFLPLDADQVNQLYFALNRLNEVCYRPENVVIFKLQPGEMIAFDNYRMFHGRTGFDFREGEGSNDRHFHGGYLDWDEINSRLNRLTLQQFQKNF